MKNLIVFLGITVLSFLLLNFLFDSQVQAGLISTKQEIAIGEDAAKYVEKQYKVVDDKAMQERVNKIGQSLVVVSQRKDIKYSFKVLESDDINAFALPGGFVYVFRGLVDKMQTDDELAGILGHEIAHVVKRHSINQLQKNIGFTVLTAVLLGRSENGLTAAPAILSAISAGYSRSDEAEADKLGFEEALAAGYNPYSMLIGLMKLNDLSPGEKTDLFSDHPSTLKRIDKMKSYLSALDIPASVQENGSEAYVYAKDVQTPALKVPADGLSPLYRAYFLLGNLYRVTLAKEYNPDYFIFDSDGSNIYIYYNDICMIKLTPDDAAAGQIELMALAQKYADSFKKILELQIHP